MTWPRSLAAALLLPALVAAQAEPERIVQLSVTAVSDRSVYLDHGQNFLGKSLVLPYSLRAVDAAPVSTPLAWEEVNERLDPRWRDQFKGKSVASPLVLDQDIRNLSGATLSSQNITRGVKRLLHTWRMVLRAP